MKTVKRKAEVGERILYKPNNTTHKVERAHLFGVTTTKNLSLSHDKYEVIIEDDLDADDGLPEVVKLENGTFVRNGYDNEGNALYSEITVDKTLAQLFDEDRGNEDEPEIPPHSSHYHQNGLDPLEVMRRTFPPEQYEGFLRGNALKYIMRYPLKGAPMEDLEKAEEYIQMLLEYQRNPEGRTKVTLRNAQGDIIEETYEEDAE